MGDDAFLTRLRTRAGDPARWIIPSTLALLTFSIGLWVGYRFLTSSPEGRKFADSVRSSNPGSHTIQNSLGIPLRALPSGAWIAESTVTAAQFEALTGSPPPFPNSSQAPPSDIPAANISHAQATAFCTILTDRERAAGFLPKSHSYRLPSPEVLPSSIYGTIGEWVSSSSPLPTQFVVASAVLAVDLPLYAPDADSYPGGWPRWHESLLSSPAAALDVRQNAAPVIEITGSSDGPSRRLYVRAAAPSPEAAADLANSAASSLISQCNALAAQRREIDWNYLRAEVDSAESRNATARSHLLDLMARYGIADSLDLPSWFVGPDDLSDDLGVQIAKNNIENLKKLLKQVEDSKGDSPPDLTLNPALSDAASSFLRLCSERKLLEVQLAQSKKNGTSDTDQKSVSLRAKISHNEEALQSARGSLLDDVSRELKVAENLLVDLQLTARRRTKSTPPSPAISDHPRAEAALESRIAYTGKQIEQLQSLQGDPLYDFALIISDQENPLRALIPEFFKHRDLHKEIMKSITALDAELEALANSSPDPEPPSPPATSSPNPDPQAERDAAEKKAAERLAKWTAQRDAKRKELETARTKKQESLKSTASDAEVASDAVAKEIASLTASLTASLERDRQELEFLIAKRHYLTDWHRLVALRTDLAEKKAALSTPPQAAFSLTPASAEETVPGAPSGLVSFVRGGIEIPAHPGFRASNLHFRIVLAEAD